MNLCLHHRTACVDATLYNAASPAIVVSCSPSQFPNFSRLLGNLKMSGEERPDQGRRIGFESVYEGTRMRASASAADALLAARAGAAARGGPSQEENHDALEDLHRSREGEQIAVAIQTLLRVRCRWQGASVIIIYRSSTTWDK